MTKQIMRLFDKALVASGLEVDSRFKKWVKWIDRVDSSKADGYAFVGEFVKEGHIEVELGQPKLLLCMAESGSMKYHYAYYQVVKLLPDGEIEKTDIGTTNKERGWALRIRDNASKLLAEISHEDVRPYAEAPALELIKELEYRGYRVTRKE